MKKNILMVIVFLLIGVAPLANDWVVPQWQWFAVAIPLDVVVLYLFSSLEGRRDV